MPTPAGFGTPKALELFDEYTFARFGEALKGLERSCFPFVEALMLSSKWLQLLKSLLFGFVFLFALRFGGPVEFCLTHF